MKISEMIKNLQAFAFEHGDVDCYYAVDDEGNGYKAVYYEPSLMYVDEYEDVLGQEDYDDTDEEDREGLAPICVVN